MDKKSKIALYVIAGVILLMMVAEVTKPKAINWRDSYSSADKIPLGCYVLFNELETFSTKPIITSNKTAYEFFGSRIDTLSPSTLVLINNYISPTPEDADAILDFVDRGNSVFISTKVLYGELRDTLNISAYNGYDDFFREPSVHSFTSPNLKEKTYTFSDVIENSFLTSVDTLNTTVIGTMSYEGDLEKEPNFVKINFGENDGAFYIHTNPFAFTNYHLLDNKEDYAATVLSYLPKQQVIWDNYYKSGRKVISSPLRYILTSPALKWAFYTSIFTLLLFVIFRGKRTQRIIPVVEPLENSTVEFTQTIGELYYQSGDYTNIIAKKIKYFLELIRTKFYLNTDVLNNSFVKKLASKSGNTIEESTAIINYIEQLKAKSFHSEKDLIALNKKIEKFTNKTK